MKYVDDFRDGTVARALGAAIRAGARPDREYRLMEFCGGHTHAISRYGIADLLPPQVRLVHGPGCPVCVLPVGRIDQAIRLALEHGVILCTYGDTLRVPASGRLSLLRAKGRGADVRMVYSPLDALQVARANPAREVVFLAIGFETTTPPTAVAVKQARAEGLGNFSLLCNHVLTPAAMHAILAAPGGVRLDGFVGPAHVSTVIGSAPYEPFARDHGKPVVIAGFEPLDVMRAIQMLIRQIDDGRAEVENEFTRAVTAEGNRKAQALVAEVFELRDAFEWRGLGTVPASALRLRPAFAGFDAEARFAVPAVPVPDHRACECAAILRGEKRPQECRIFGTACTPDNPVGSCMVSSEGACAAHYTYGRFRVEAAPTETTRT
ncbi:hydrogenase formation protein HypD [Thauera sinica]|uniref:Hydrogenase maturation factor n=1 Tax=Thauera sinica TaxID=2665146 RepID=A0ABW1ARW9_9RHOO|nr:hydrogenase formation protein HypD [Thauera sp. K11]ATE62176.1 hydrogenase formation protein HypD [Thauera sp. K11]